MEDIYDFIKKEEKNYSMPISLEEGWEWSMAEHLRQSFLYKNSQFLEHNEDRHLRPNKNIIPAILNVQYRTEGFDVKDIELFVDSTDGFYKSFLAKKYHDNWALENGQDTFIDEVIESYCDYGGTLVRNKGEKRPVVEDLRTLAFCNQKDILNYPFGFKRTFSQADLREAGEKNGWGNKKNGATITIEELIVLAKKEEDDEIEIYEIYGTLPKEYLQKEYQEIDIENKDVMQQQIVAYYKNDKGDKVGETLYRTRVPDLGKLFKMLKRDNIKGRALGRGGIEELFEPQKWTNWAEIKVTEYLEAASKIINLTDNPQVAKKHKNGLKDLDHHDLVEVNSGTKGIWQLDNTPRNIPLFEKSVAEWENHAQKVGGATDPLQGETPPSGTPFKLYERQSIEAKGMHAYRRGKVATFVEEIYRDWILPHIIKEIAKDQSFLSSLSGDEMMKVSESFAKHYANKKLAEKVLNGQSITPDEKETFLAQGKEEFVKSDKKFIEILKEDFKNEPINVRVNIAGKQKNLDMLTDKLTGVLTQWMQMRANGVDTKGLDNILNTILESSGLSPVMFGYNQPTPQTQQNAGNIQGQAPAFNGGQINTGGNQSPVQQ